VTTAPSTPVEPTVGLGVVHLFARPTSEFDRGAVVNAVKEAGDEGVQVVATSMLGHKCDLGFMALHSDLRALRRFQSALSRAGLDIVDSYVSLTEVSEYAAGMPEEMLRPRLHPQLPPDGKPAFCFYPMSKKREGDANWFTLPFDQRKELMHEHGSSGRKFAGRVLQVVTGSAGFDDYEWGVTLFGVHPDDLKEVVYTMRFDRASAVYADFGPFYVGMVTPVEELVDTV
jgi:hydrogen peroxide-dependent heme synthase